MGDGGGTDVDGGGAELDGSGEVEGAARTGLRVAETGTMGLRGQGWQS